MSENIVHKVHLSLPGGTRVLSGKEVGIHAREQHSLDKWDSAAGIVDVVVDVPVITSSFFLGMFSQSVKKLGGVDNFFKKYHFHAKESVIKNIEANARYSATDATALS
jgi:hypothetical protein